MSVVYEHATGWVISHQSYIKKTYEKTLNSDRHVSLEAKRELFDVNTPYRKAKEEESSSKRRKRKRKNPESNSCLQEIITHVKDAYLILKEFARFSPEIERCNNETATEASKQIYEETGRVPVRNTFGSNPLAAGIREINRQSYVFPENCSFFCKDVSEMSQELAHRRFDLVLLDPPWWNKYIRRVKKAKGVAAYDMMQNEELAVNIPLPEILSEDGLVVVWCTNSPQNLRDLESDVFPKWGVKKVATWFWLKVTKSGEPVLPFNEPLQKQPFEQIIFASAVDCKIPDGKLVVSVPSALHSHKPPLIDLLKQFLPPEPECLEIFARYLLPNFTSYGLEALRFQHLSCYEEINTG